MIADRKPKKIRGKYKRYLYTVFGGIGILFIMIFSLILGLLFYIKARNERRIYFQNMVKTQEMLLVTTTTSVQREINKIELDQDLKRWVQASVSSENYYYYGTNLYKKIQETSANLIGADIEIIIAQNDSDAFVITKNGTKDWRTFFTEKESGITYDQWEQILDKFGSVNSRQIIPIIKESDLCGFYLVYKYKIYADNVFLIAKFPIDNIVEESGMGYFLLGENYQELYRKYLSEEFIQNQISELNTQTTKLDMNGISIFSNYKEDIFYLKVDDLPLLFGYVWKFSYTQLLFSYVGPIVIWLIAVGIFMFLIYKVVHKLYQPVDSIIGNMGLTSKLDVDTVYNEFETLDNHIKSIQATNNIYSKNKYYREALYQVPEGQCLLTPDEQNALYAVVIIRIELGDVTQTDYELCNEQVKALKNSVENKFKGKQIYFIKENVRQAAIIIRMEQGDNTIEYMDIIQENTPEIVNYKISVGSICQGYQNIHISYEKALKLQRRARNTSSVDDNLYKMQNYIYENYMTDIMLVDIAEYCNMSESYCSTLFKQLSNSNFKVFLNRYRIQKACEKMILSPELKISDIGEQVGFNSPNSFIRAFKQIVEMTPKNFANLDNSEKVSVMKGLFEKDENCESDANNADSSCGINS